MTSNTDRASLKPRAEDVASPDAIIKAAYEALSGPRASATGNACAACTFRAPA